MSMIFLRIFKPCGAWVLVGHQIALVQLWFALLRGQFQCHQVAEYSHSQANAPGANLLWWTVWFSYVFLNFFVWFWHVFTIIRWNHRWFTSDCKLDSASGSGFERWSEGGISDRKLIRERLKSSNESMNGLRDLWGPFAVWPLSGNVWQSATQIPSCVVHKSISAFSAWGFRTKSGTCACASSAQSRYRPTWGSEISRSKVKRCEMCGVEVGMTTWFVWFKNRGETGFL